MNSRGQAALVDSLFFIAIVSTVCTGLFYFAINYGTTTETQLNSFYSSDFAMDSLKVLTYINLYRDGNSVNPNDVINITPGGGAAGGGYIHTFVLGSSVPQTDYLLAMIKEDFAKNKEITIPTKTAIANTLHSVLKPFDSSIDYIFFIAKESTTASESRFITMILSTRKCTAGCDYMSEASSRVISRVYYSCNPLKANVIEKYIFPYAGKVDSASGKISLVDFVGTSTGRYSYYVTGLYLWVAKDINKINQIVKTEGLPPGQKEPDFDCVLLPTN